jgi:hypothetical protein
LAGVEAFVEVDPVFLFDMPADESRIRNHDPVIFDVGELPLRRLGEARRVRAVRELRYLQEHFDFRDKRTGIRQAEARTEAVKRDHGSFSNRGARTGNLERFSWFGSPVSG